MNKFAGVIMGGVMLAGGGTLTADQLINPYQSVDTIENGKTVTTLQIDKQGSLPEEGAVATIVDTSQPKITLQKWGGEVAMGVTYTGITSTGDRPFLSKNVTWTQDPKQSMEAVPIDATTTMEDGGMEINLILNSAPTSNVFNFALDGTDNLDFFYQPPLTDQEIKDGASRPANVEGSYAVYYKNHANHIEGQTNYATGKAFHIFRPLVTDAKGATVWADLSYSNGVLTVTVPQSFLDGAVYPVKVDPTFGYTTIGGTALVRTSANVDRSNVRSTLQYVASAGDTITGLSAYGLCTAAGTGGSVGVSVYTFSGGVPVTRLLAEQTASPMPSGSPNWVNVNGLSTAMSAGTTYVVGFGNWSSTLPTTCSSSVQFYEDTLSAGDNSQNASGALPATWTQTITDAIVWSFYATYTAGGGATTPAHAIVSQNKSTVSIPKGTVTIP